MPRKASKKEVRTVLHKELIRQQILPEESGIAGAEGGAATPVEVDKNPSSVVRSPVRPGEPSFVPHSTPYPMSGADPMLAIK